MLTPVIIISSAPPSDGVLDTGGLLDVVVAGDSASADIIMFVRVLTICHKLEDLQEDSRTGLACGRAF